MQTPIPPLAREVFRSPWRTPFAPLIAAVSFLLGQADEFPEPFPILFLALPALAVLLTVVSRAHFGLIGH